MMKNNKKLDLKKINGPIFLKIVDSNKHLVFLKINEIRAAYSITESR